MTLVISMVFLNAVNVHAAASKDIPDLLYFDGSSWNRIEHISPEWAMTFKSFLVRGIYEGAYTVNPKMFTEHFNNDTSYREIVNALDEYYQDERNLHTPVAYAIMLVLKVPQAQASPPVRGTALISKGPSS